MDTIWPQVKQLVNNYTVKNLNTGDRVVDSAITIILLIIFDLLSKYLYSLIIKCFEKKVIIGNNPWEFDTTNVILDRMEDVLKYKFSLDMCEGDFTEYTIKDPITHSYCEKNPNNMTLLNMWVEKFLHTPILEMVGTTSLFCYKGQLHTVDNAINQFMPIWSYKYDSKYEYMYIIKDKIYCNHKIELDKFVKHFYDFLKSIDMNEIYKEKLVINEICKNEDYHVKKVYKLSFSGFVNVHKTFDGLYVDEKEQIMTIVDKFVNKKMYPGNLHLDNKLGILLHGPPGTGKSGFVSCLANKLGRSIMLIDSINVERNIIISAINDNKKTHIIVLDEIDKLLETFDGLKDNDLGSIFTASNEAEREKIINSLASKTASSTKKKEMSDITFLMKLLDSFGDDTDRIVVATTNHPEKIPSALVRPGRFDKIVCLTYCSLQMFTDIVRQVYDDIDQILLDDRTKNLVIKMLTLNVTPLILINACVTTESFMECLEKLQRLIKTTYDGKIIN
jgi:hypothetical protein